MFFRKIDFSFLVDPVIFFFFLQNNVYSGYCFNTTCVLLNLMLSKVVTCIYISKPICKSNNFRASIKLRAMRGLLIKSMALMRFVESLAARTCESGQ